jgi:hypothetical protein
MAYQQKDLSGSAWKNDRKREGKKDPDYTGSMIVRGETFWLDIWVVNKPGTDGYDSNKKTFLSLSLRSKEARSANKPDPAKRQHDMSKPRHFSPPPPPGMKSEPPAEAVDPDSGEFI